MTTEVISALVPFHCEFGLCFFLTEDLSPSVAFGNADERSELMHSKRGAFSETVHVYLPAVKKCIEKSLPPLFLSMGLGLGYIEILTIASLMSLSPETLQSKDFFLASFEKKDLLVKVFQSFFLKKETPSIFRQCYENILLRTAQHFDLDPKEIFAKINSLLIRNSITLYSEFNEKTNLNHPATCIFFDAFSPAESPELWTTDILNHLFNDKLCSHKAVFATYSSRGFLKKILTENDFTVEKKAGFMGKRECLFAHRAI